YHASLSLYSSRSILDLHSFPTRRSSDLEPTSNGIGGDAFALVWVKDKLHGLNSSGPAPKSISPEAVKALGHEKMPIHGVIPVTVDRKSTRLNSSHVKISYAVFCLKKKKK